MRKCVWIVVLGMIVILSSGCSSHRRDTAWKAQWIADQQQAAPNTWLCFRKTITIDKPVQSAQARIACDSKYWLWVNGQMVIFEGQLKRGPNPNDTYYDPVDLKPYLKSGENTLAVLVWYWGKHGFTHNNSGRAGLVFDSDINGRHYGTDRSWKVMKHPAYGDTGDPKPNYRLAESNIRFDAQKDIPGWFTPDFDDSAWTAAAELGCPPVGPWNHLEKRPISQWKDWGLVDYETVTEKTGKDGQKIIIGKLPYNAQVTPYLKIKSPAGQLIDLRTDNYMGGSAPGVRAEYVTRPGLQDYESLGWMNGHEVHYTMPAEVKVLAVQYRQTGYDAEFAGAFTCDDPALNTLWEKARRTLYITMRDNYMDCPDRERAQWWGDAVNELGEAFYVFDAEKGPLLTRKAIYELARWQRPDKVLYSPVPAGVPGADNQNMKKEDGSWYKELAPQMLASVGWYGFWTYYWYTGDTQTMVDVYPHVRDYLSLWKIGTDGLVVHRTGDWEWTDWGEQIDTAVLDNTWVYLAMKGAIEMARLSGNQADIAGYKKTMQSIEDHFNKTFWQGDKYRDPKYKGKTDDRANAMAVVAGLARPEYYPAIKQVLKSEEHASPYMEKYVLEALYLMDAPEQAIERMKKRWADQIQSPITTLWEGWGLGAKGFGGGTYNHAWSGGALTMLSQYAAGIAPTKPAFAEFAVLPRMGPLKTIQSNISTSKGLIEVTIKQDDTTFSLAVSAPKETQCVVGVPASFQSKTITLNHAVIWQDGKPQRLPAGVTCAGQDEKFIRFRIPTGGLNSLEAKR